MTQQEKIDHMHRALAYVIKQGNTLVTIFNDDELAFTHAEAEIILDQLNLEHLLNPTREYGLLELSPRGRDIAQAEGGYKAHIEEQQREIAWVEEERQLNRTSTAAAVQSAEAADRSAKAADNSAIWAKVAAIAAIIAIFISLFALAK